MSAFRLPPPPTAAPVVDPAAGPVVRMADAPIHPLARGCLRVPDDQQPIPWKLT